LSDDDQPNPPADLPASDALFDSVIGRRKSPFIGMFIHSNILAFNVCIKFAHKRQKSQKARRRKKLVAAQNFLERRLILVDLISRS
jgi:hypothetical protein